MALVFPSCDQANVTSVTNGNLDTLVCATNWEFLSAEQVVDSASAYDLSIADANLILGAFATVLAGVFMARIVFRLLAEQFGRP